MGRTGVDFIGSVIADRYRIEANLGEGGMGQVYLAEHVRMKRKSAIKIMRPALVGDVEALQRFTREAESASQISHPNVAAIYDFGETDDGIVYLAMEYVDGEPLATKLQRELAIHPDAAADILGQSADALQAAHDMGILHRDLKPDNIMLGRRPDGTYHVKLVDFGIARTIERDEQRLTRTGFAVGTPEYMSPEQLAGDTLDARSDQYSLALVAFVALTGKDAFPAETSKESLVARLTSRPRTLQEANHDIRWPAALQSIFDKALSPEATDRYPTVREFAEALASAISVMTPSQTAAMYRRALEQRLASVAMRTPHSDINAIRTSQNQQQAVAEEQVVTEPGEEARAETAAAPAWVAAARSADAEMEKEKPSALPVSPEAMARHVRRRKFMSWAVRSVLIMSGAFVIGLLAWALWLDEPAGAVAAADSASVLPTDSVSPIAMQMSATGGAAGQARTPREIADSIVRARDDSVRKDSVARSERARLDSIRRRAEAIATFPAGAISEGRIVPPNWRERSTRGSDIRVVVMTPQVSAWRADEVQRWKGTHVRTDNGAKFDIADPIERWGQWKRLVSARLPVVVIEVKSERAPFEHIEPEKLTDFRRGDVQSVQLLRDGVAVKLLDGERFPAVVNDGYHRQQEKVVPHSFAAMSEPDAFAPRADGSWPKIELFVVDAMNRNRELRLQLSETIVRKVHDDFKPYRDALKQF